MQSFDQINTPEPSPARSPRGCPARTAWMARPWTTTRACRLRRRRRPPGAGCIVVGRRLQPRRPRRRASRPGSCPSDVDPTEHVEQSFGTNLAGLGDRSFPSDLVPALAIDLACGRKSLACARKMRREWAAGEEEARA
jgi:hypothetical protein